MPTDNGLTSNVLDVPAREVAVLVLLRTFVTLNVTVPLSVKSVVHV
jgi:hypothetical protein